MSTEAGEVSAEVLIQVQVRFEEAHFQMSPRSQVQTVERRRAPIAVKTPNPLLAFANAKLANRD